MFTSCIGVFILWTLIIRGLFRNREKLTLNGEHELHGLARAVLIRFLTIRFITPVLYILVWNYLYCTFMPPPPQEKTKESFKCLIR